MKVLECQNISYKVKNKSILKDISFSVDMGDYISIVGPSGSGKSTMLKLLGHLLSPTEGTLLYKNQNYVSYSPLELRKQIAYCFQTPYLFGHTVEENLHFPFIVEHMPPNTEKIEQLLAQFQLPSQIVEESVQNLSGGEKQRLSLIRTLLLNPQVLLLDEPTSALDEKNTQILEKTFQQLNQSGTTIVLVTHSLEQSQNYSNKRLTFIDGQLESLEVLR